MFYSKEFLQQLDKVQQKEIYAKISALTFNETPIETIEGRITAGSINVDGSSAVRRTCSLTVVAENFDYNNYVWGLNTKFKLEIGVKNTINQNYPNVIWFKQGVYVLTSFNVSRSTTNFTINLSGKDKMCLLNGEMGGVFESSIDFGQIEEENADGNWIIRKIPIHEIIRNAVHVYGKEPYHNIIINDLDTYGVELLEYRYDIPMYLYRSADENAQAVYDNAILENNDTVLYIKENNAFKKVKLNELPLTYLESLIDIDQTNQNVGKVYTQPKDNSASYYFTKIENGQTAGYRETELTFAGDLIAKVGESLTSILDKIKNMLTEFEYFYNLEGQFIFQKKQSFIETMWSPSQSEDTSYETLPNILAGKTELYTFTNNELITAFNNNPNIGNLKNDFSVWGERFTVSGTKIPVHMRYAIDDKPAQYKTIKVTAEEIQPYNQKYNTQLKPQLNQITYISASQYRTYTINNDIFIECDWREVIYQMAKDYFKYNHLDSFELKVSQANPEYLLGRTGYESYYTDLQGFWRELYYPSLAEDFTEIVSEYENLDSEIQLLESKLYGTEVSWSENTIGGLENDVCILNNLISNGTAQSYNDAKTIISYWNTRNGSLPNNVYSDDFEQAPKYALYDDAKRLINDPDVYLSMLQDLYFRTKSQLSIKQMDFNEVSIKKKSLEDNIRANYYVKETIVQDESGNNITVGVKENSPLLHWNKNVYESPYLLNFWFDFLDGKGLEKFNVRNVGNRPKAIQDSNVKSIYFRETPSIMFREADDGISYDEVDPNKYPYEKNTYYIKDNDVYYLSTAENLQTGQKYYKKVYTQFSGFKTIQVPAIETMFSISSQGKSAKEKLDELLYAHSYCIETATITTIPIYYLEPNTRIRVYDDKSKLNGDYIINKITIPLVYNGTMSLSVTKTVEDLI